MVSVIDHTETSRRLIQQAHDELAQGDLLQASEKGWGAAAHAMKGIARSRGWKHDTHAALLVVARRIADEADQPAVRTLFQVASVTHKNFYEGWLDVEDLARNLSEIRTLLDMLESVSTT